MGGVYVLFYSDKKIALELDLEREETVMPHFSAIPQSKTELIELLNKAYSIEIEDYEVLEEDKDSLSVLIGGWEGRLKQNSPNKRLIWQELSKCSKILSENDQKPLTFFMENYVEVLLGSLTVGISRKEECEKHNLTTKGVTALLKDQKGHYLVNKHENDKYSSLFTHQKIGESPEEAVFRLLREEYGTICEINLLKSHFEKNKRLNNQIYIGYHDQSLTFVNKRRENTAFLSPEMLKKAHLTHEKGFPEDFLRILEAIEGEI